MKNQPFLWPWTEELLVKLYYQGYSIRDLVKLSGKSRTTIRRRFNQLGVILRPKDTALKLSESRGKRPGCRKGQSKSFVNRRNIGIARALWCQNNSPFDGKANLKPNNRIRVGGKIVTFLRARLQESNINFEENLKRVQYWKAHKNNFFLPDYNAGIIYYGALSVIKGLDDKEQSLNMLAGAGISCIFIKFWITSPSYLVLERVFIQILNILKIIKTNNLYFEERIFKIEIIDKDQIVVTGEYFNRAEDES